MLIENTRCGATIIVTYYVPGTRLRHDFHLRHPRRSIRPRPIHQGGGWRLMRVLPNAQPFFQAPLPPSGAATFSMNRAIRSLPPLMAGMPLLSSVRTTTHPSFRAGQGVPVDVEWPSRCSVLSTLYDRGIHHLRAPEPPPRMAPASVPTCSAPRPNPASWRILTCWPLVAAPPASLLARKAASRAL